MVLPKYTGPFRVGCVDVMTKAESIPDSFDPYTVCSSNLGSLMRMYYPCISDACEMTYKYSKWIPEPHQSLYSYGFMKATNLRWISWLGHFITKNYKSHAQSNAPLLDHASWQKMQTITSLKNKEKLPLVIFSHGLTGQRGIYSVFCTQLASEGFVVASVEHRDTSASSSFIINTEGHVIEIPYHVEGTADNDDEAVFQLRNTQVVKRTKEIEAALDVLTILNENPQNVENCLTTELDVKTFKDRIDTHNVLMMGHSFGAATALNSLKKIERLRCGFVFDPWFVPLSDAFYEEDKSSEKPVFILFTEAFNWKKNVIRTNKYIKNASKGFVEMVTLKNTNHWDQCDAPAFIPSWVLKKSNMAFDEATKIQRKIVFDYFGKYFTKEDNSSPVNLLSEEYDLPAEFMLGTNIKLDDV